MARIVGVAIARQQFVGYWGAGDGAAAARSLHHLLQADPDPTWQHRTAAFADGILASLSAAGLPTIAVHGDWWPDAWVRLGQANSRDAPTENLPERLTLGREPFGRVPLYWMQINGVLWFASRLSLLQRLWPTTPTLNQAALYGYSCFSYIPTPLTPFIEIHALPAGVCQTWALEQDGTLVVVDPQPIWEWQQQLPEIDDEGAAIAQLQTLLKQAVARQIRDVGDRPVGVLLSGGLDSATVAALLVQAGVRVRAYSLDFGDGEQSEYPYAAQVAAWLGIPITRVDASPRTVRRAIAPTMAALDQPFGDGVTVPLYLLHQAARQDVEIVFNGEGGDQLFAGWTNKPLIAAEVYQAAVSNSRPSFAQHYLRTFHRFWGYESQVFQPAVATQFATLDPAQWLTAALDSRYTDSLLHRLRRAGLLLKGAQNIHPRATQLAIAHGLWLRSPFCDLGLAEWSFRLSGRLCLQAACEKYILKRAVDEWLPPDIVWRRKRGMGVPLTGWCVNDWWHDLGRWLNPAVLQAEGIWQPDVAARLVAGEVGSISHGRRIGESLWLLIAWQQWRSQQFPLSATPNWAHPFWLPRWLWQQLP